MAKLLLDHGADVNAIKSSSGTTPLSMAVQNNHPAMVSLLLSFDADPNLRCFPGFSPLQTAIGRGYYKLVAQLINGGATITLEELASLTQILRLKKTMDANSTTISGCFGAAARSFIIRPNVTEDFALL
jgi:ankyrin repeat protein